MRQVKQHLTGRRAWRALAAHQKKIKGLHLRQLFAADPKRNLSGSYFACRRAPELPMEDRSVRRRFSCSSRTSCCLPVFSHLGCRNVKHNGGSNFNSGLRSRSVRTGKREAEFEAAGPIQNQGKPLRNSKPGSTRPGPPSPKGWCISNSGGFYTTVAPIPWWVWP